MKELGSAEKARKMKELGSTKKKKPLGKYGKTRAIIEMEALHNVQIELEPTVSRSSHVFSKHNASRGALSTAANEIPAQPHDLTPHAPLDGVPTSLS